MNVTSINASIWESASLGRQGASVPGADRLAGGNQEAGAEDSPELRQAFQSFVGETLFGQMLKAARKTQNKPAYFHGGRAEEIFQQQLDQVLAEKMACSEGARYSEAMFELFTLKRN